MKKIIFVLTFLCINTIHPVKINFDLKFSPKQILAHILWFCKQKPVHGTAVGIGATIATDAFLKACIKRKYQHIPATFYEPVVCFAIIGAILAKIDALPCCNKLSKHKLIVLLIALAAALLTSIPTEILNVIESTTEPKKHIISLVKQALLNAEALIVSYLTTHGLEKANWY